MMSWSFSYTSEDKHAALAKLDEITQQQSGHLPKSVASMVARAIDALPDCDESIINVASYGHFNNSEHRGTSNMTINVSNAYKPVEPPIEPK